jgi:predicted ester cyclase
MPPSRTCGWSFDELVVADDKAVIFFTLTGMHEGPLMGIPPTGKEKRVHGVVRSRFEDGRIVEEWEVLDQLAMLTQLDVVSLPS